MTDQEKKDLAQHMLDEVTYDLERKGKTNDFISSLQDWFQEKGFLSDKQLAALTRFYDRLC